MADLMPLDIVVIGCGNPNRSDDGVGPQTDEFFTLAIGGMCTLLNNSGTAIFPGDMSAHHPCQA